MVDPEAMQHLRSGLSLMDNGLFEQAVDAFQKAVEIEPDFGDAWFTMGVLLVQLGRNEDAIPALEQSVALIPDDPSVSVTLADAYLGAKQYGKAERMAAIGLEQDICNDKHWFTLASAKLAKGDYEGARMGFQRLLELTPADPRVWYNLSQATYHLREIPAAVEMAEAATRIGEHTKEHWLWLSTVYTAAGRDADAQNADARAATLD
jgi:tetratricopeptide (TPR) repeat protein